MTFRRILAGVVALAGLASLACAALPAVGQTLSDRPVRIVIPYSPGATSDTFSRLVAQKVEEMGGPKVVVESKPGGGGTIAAMTVKQAAPDGTTLFLCDLGTFGINLSMFPDLGYDPLRDFKPITALWAFPSVLSVPASLPASSVKELIELAKKTPNGMSYGSQGVGSGGHILGAMLAKSTGAPLVHVPYKGAAPAIADLVIGQVSLLFGSVASVQGHYEAKRLRPLAVTSRSRLPVLPDVPTIGELGYPEIDLDVWFGLAAPAGTPDAVVLALHDRFVKAARAPDFVAKLQAGGVLSVTSSPAEFAALIKADAARLAPIVKESGAKVN
jgi:tripartite-type tricarboxylate transporter receptor subunit TctC